MYKILKLWIISKLLISIDINNYTLVDHLEIEFAQGTTAISGETGAGKSLVLDALAMALGGRADSGTIRHGQTRAEICARFDLTQVGEARDWLLSQDFDGDRDCVLRRLYSVEGRSRGYINGQSCTMQQLQMLGEMLIDIHSQHEHQSLLRKETHRRLLDEYAGAQPLAAKVSKQFGEVRTLQQAIAALQASSADTSARIELLQFQIEELAHLDIQSGEFERLESEQRGLANAEQIIRDSRQLLALCEQDEQSNIRDSLNRGLSILAAMAHRPEALDSVEEMLRSSLIQVEEAAREIEASLDGFNLDPERLAQVNERLSAMFQLARKHRVKPSELRAKATDLAGELGGLQGGDKNLQGLGEQLQECSKAYLTAAKKLAASRSKAAKKMAVEINQQLHALAMPGADFTVAQTAYGESEWRASGLNEIEFVISTNPGQPHKALQKIASGGELSRVSLAIQVVAAQHSNIPTLVFDEVDVGIGGATADVVGRLLKSLGAAGQVISVTHQPQVAAHAHHHYVAEKVIASGNTASLMSALEPAQRADELARMLGGAEITEQTLLHAQEMLELAKKSL
ncbi:DNA repair protein RecN [Porticoccaceae bacterium]|nr:DNA repair protein RecN [Porticoccaceae bacterium]